MPASTIEGLTDYSIDIPSTALLASDTTIMMSQECCQVGGVAVQPCSRLLENLTSAVLDRLFILTVCAFHRQIGDSNQQSACYYEYRLGL